MKENVGNNNSLATLGLRAASVAVDVRHVTKKLHISRKTAAALEDPLFEVHGWSLTLHIGTVGINAGIVNPFRSDFPIPDYKKNV